MLINLASQYAPWLPSRLFANGQQGVWYVPQPVYRGDQVLFQDDAGTTPVTADGDPVGYMEDLSGNGNHATQSTASAKPIYRTDGTLHWLEFDGVDDSIGSAFSSTLPYTRVGGLNIISLDVNDYVFTGDTNRSTLYRRSSSPVNQLTMFNDANGPEAVSSNNKVVTSEEYLTGVDNLYFDGSLVSSGEAGDAAGTGLYIGGASTGGNESKILMFGVVQASSMGSGRVEAEKYIAKITGATL